LHALDAVSGFVFRRRHPTATAEAASWRAARLYQGLNAFLLIWVPLAVLGLFVSLSHQPPALLMVHVWLAPSVFCVAWLIGKSLWGRPGAVVCVAAMLVPCVNLALLGYLWFRARNAQLSS
jgi:hypothetical protein